MESIAEESEPRADPRLGTTLRGKYRLDRILGTGGMAVVYASTHRNQKQFAVKVLHAQLSADADLRRRFLREGYIANQVKHPNAVAVLDDDVAEDGSAFLVMELLEGETVKGLWEHGGTLDVRTVLTIAHEVLEVLSAAHDNGIVHRDIKPANLLVTREAVKVLDFGIAKIRDGSTHQTTHSSMLGTPAFMSPEQASGEHEAVGPLSDIWAVGATMFLLLSGEPVHVGKNAPQLLLKAASTPPRSLRTIAPDLPASVIALVDKALAFRRFQRWESAAAMRAAVAQAADELFGQPSSPRILAELLTPEALRTNAHPAHPARSGSRRPAEAGRRCRLHGSGGHRDRPATFAAQLRGGDRGVAIALVLGAAIFVGRHRVGLGAGAPPATDSPAPETAATPAVVMAAPVASPSSSAASLPPDIGTPAPSAKARETSAGRSPSPRPSHRAPSRPFDPGSVR